MTRIGYQIDWVADVDASASFYETAFGFARINDMTTPLTRWVELDGGGVTLAFAAFTEADVLFPAGYRRHDPGEAPVASQITIVADDVDAAFKAAIAAGAKALNAPKEEPWGQTVARIRDPNGRLVSLATPMRR
jgi:lactoylglutathione lyase